MHKVMILNQKDVETLLDMKEVLQVVEAAFKSEAGEKQICPLKYI